MRSMVRCICLSEKALEQDNVKRFFVILNVMAPLIVGAVIYYVFFEETIFVRLIDDIFGLGCNALIVNDYMITDLFSATVAAGKKDYETLDLSSSGLKAAGIDNVGKIEIYFHTFDPDTYKTITDLDCVTIQTSAFDSMDSTPNDAGQELYNADGIRIVGKYVDENSFWGAAVLLYIENNGGENRIIQCDDMSINGFMVTPYFSSTVYDGKKAIDEITLMSSELEENNITSVDEIELKFKIIDENYTSRAETDTISFSAK